jgi:hypothetical protein
VLGRTPKIGKKGHQEELGGKEDQKFETRIVAVEVACGPFQTTFVYTTDNLQSGGANLMVRDDVNNDFNLFMEVHLLRLKSSDKL